MAVHEMIDSSHLKIIYETHKKKRHAIDLVEKKRKKNKSRCIFLLFFLAEHFPLNDKYFVFKNIICLS